MHLQPQVQIVDVDKDATFQCMISGHPVNDVKWMHNGKAISRNSRIEVNVGAGWQPGTCTEKLIYLCF